MCTVCLVSWYFVVCYVYFIVYISMRCDWFCVYHTVSVGENGHALRRHCSLRLKVKGRGGRARSISADQLVEEESTKAALRS